MTKDEVEALTTENESLIEKLENNNFLISKFQAKMKEYNLSPEDLDP